MPYLMIDLTDPTDCQRGMRQLRRHLRRGEADAGVADCDGPRQRGPQGAGGKTQGASGKTPLKQKLARIRQRGVWRFLVQIAKLDNQPRSLGELDEALELPRNKMRSTKAIFAKLENRLDVRFLKVAQDAGEDESGNPRYVMPPRIRKLILQLAE